MEYWIIGGGVLVLLAVHLWAVCTLYDSLTDEEKEQLFMLYNENNDL